MLSDQSVEEIGVWKKEKVLGAGGFGYVVLWRNKVSNETIALKGCRWGHDPMITPKHRTRWKLEVDMMSRLNHSNIVRAIAVPPELDVPATEMPLLAMEYCKNGDLRKLLNKPENCCGLKEMHVRLIMKHVSSAVNYLHSMRIIHRDLKPENIVIQDINGKVVYKLIDLGYAKELDQGSLCTSFVGTLQYLAPELFMSQKYSCTVDYWSLGLVTHEIITGLRPFLPDKSPAEWIPIIKQKSSTEIRAVLDADKNIVFSDEISPYHHISSHFKKDVEKWLQLMLEWDSKKRGRNENYSAFNLLDTILQKKIAFVFCSETFQLLSFQIEETSTFKDFYLKLEKEFKIPVNQMEILLSNGNEPNLEKGPLQFSTNLEEEQSIIFLFNKSESSSSSLPTTTPIPPCVGKMMITPDVEVDYQTQRTAWAQAVYLIQKDCLLIKRLIEAFKANLMHLLANITNMHKNISRMTTEMHKVLAKCSLFRNSLKQDLKSYELQCQHGGFNSVKLYEDWKKTLENLEKVDLLRQKIANLEAESSSLSAHAIELQRSQYAKSKLDLPLDDLYRQLLDGYGMLKKRSSEQRRVCHKNTEVVKLICLSLQHSHQQTQDVSLHIRKVKEIKCCIHDCLPQITHLIAEITDWDIQIESWQARRQRSLWKVIETLSERAYKAERSASPMSISSSPQSVQTNRYFSTLGASNSPRNSPDFSSPFSQSPKTASFLKTPPIITPPSWQNRLESLRADSQNTNDVKSENTKPSRLFSMDVASLSHFLDEKAEDTRRVKKENESLVESFQNMMDVLKSFQETDVNFETGLRNDTSNPVDEKNK